MSSPVLKALVAARQKCLTEDEAYWDPKPDFTRPVSARNEAAALSWMLDHQAAVCRGGPADVAELRALCANYCVRLGAATPPEQQAEEQGGEEKATAAAADSEPADAGPDGAVHGTAGEAAVGSGPEAAARGGLTSSSSGRSFGAGSVEEALQRWCTQRGVRGAASPALFGRGGGQRGGGSSSGTAAQPPPPLRGLRADTAVAPGDVVLHVPADLLISYETAKKSDLGKVLSALPLDLSDDSIALIWTCVERHEPEAPHAPFWAALPHSFSTALSASQEDVALLEGTPLHGDAVRARQHLSEAFESSSPAFRSLLGAYPDYFKPEWFSWESYLWAAELWYSYGIQVQFASGDIRTCLAPYLGLMNHHPLPHVVHFSKVDPETGCLRVRAFRPCEAGNQLFLSYGPYSNAKLLLFYGFAVRDNPADEVELVLQVPPGAAATDRRALLAAGLSLEHRLRAGGRLAPPLLSCARLLAAPPPLLKQWRRMPPAEVKAAVAAPIDAESEAVAMGLLGDAIEALLRPARDCAARLRSQEVGKEAREGFAAAVGGEEQTAVGPGTELRRFARVYVDGLVRVLEDALAAVRRGPISPRSNAA
ncbi:hypothetical protein VOLCADRAFT_120737 [Volvox carteri f. nagariensis]|uniref:SET domain-containing protein n=1 Tax=Volvox carteri f. nagariensis TaxID=3068 RepID=D8TSB7_VOLCA|nr:uncharacterized protein VOLCADRAFT_120737 [Volvox carteri f. nagariensis]EFJ49666.1 hypothetical protein VOLCADRAFT_120737 [Volvox carteri f. nagariensis]|eukprot:XP_002949173.1 hypothetical protein VOLCADRAFT_120737 [Volvox carteri f. nagariensis]